jgi:hypothetical protein
MLIYKNEFLAIRIVGVEGEINARRMITSPKFVESDCENIA